MTGPTHRGAASSQGVDRQLEMLRAVARRTGNAVIVTDTSGRIEWVNEGFSRLTGFLPEEAVGQRPGELLQGPDTDPGVRAHMAASIARREPFEAVVLNYGKGGQQYWVRIEAEPLRDADGAVTGYIAIETDVTEQRINERWEQLTRRIGERLYGCASVQKAARTVVEALVDLRDIRAACAWTVERGRPTLRFQAGAIAGPECADWLDVTSTRSFARGTEWIVGVGAPGVAWGTGAPCKKTDFWERDAHGNYSRRAEASRRAGIRTICAVPVLGPDGVLAVLEFGGSHNFPGHERLPGLLELVAQQFGAFISQVRSQRAFEALFRHSPDALLVVDAAGAVTDANARAEALFGGLSRAVKGASVDALLEEGSALLTSASEDAMHARTAFRGDGTPFAAEVTVSRSSVTGAPADMLSVRDLTERRKAEETLRRSLAEKVTLVQEVHHRVKNNLQVLSSLLSLQADDLEDPGAGAPLRDTVHRIQSMALVHQQLYGHDDLSCIGFDAYARELCTALRGSLAPDADLTFDTEPVEIPVERAVPAGLILNELVTNAFKYGRSPDGRARVRVEVRATERGFRFMVSDQGPGLAGATPRRGSMGATLVQALSRQLRARRSVGEGPGTSLAFEVDERG
jgi:PAS domain S-box-containing protein